jgi:hypothetical protein
LAFILSPEGQAIYLSVNHTFGRIYEKVDTQIKGSYVSRLHAVIQWHESHWMIRDFSTNGTWLNGAKITSNRQVSLTSGNVIQFGSPSSSPYVVKDVSPPIDVLICSSEKLNENGMLRTVPLRSYHFLPDDNQPEVVLYKKSNTWFVDNLADAHSSSHPVKDGEQISFGSNNWILRSSEDNAVTKAVESNENTLNGGSLKFYLSLDEEHCNIQLFNGDTSFNLSDCSHHLMTLMLARYKARDIDKGISESEQGWVFVSQLCKDIGLDESHINIQIHRARKQLAEIPLIGGFGSEFIMRRRGQIRLGISTFLIEKAGLIEFSNLNEM